MLNQMGRAIAEQISDTLTSQATKGPSPPIRLARMKAAGAVGIDV
jgi:hypothetical protein